MRENIVKWAGYILAAINALLFIATFIVDEFGAINDHFAVVTEFITGSLVPVLATLDLWLNKIIDHFTKSKKLKKK